MTWTVPFVQKFKCPPKYIFHSPVQEVSHFTSFLDGNCADAKFQNLFKSSNGTKKNVKLVLQQHGTLLYPTYYY